MSDNKKHLIQNKCSNPSCLKLSASKICSRCKSARYCSVECQTMHWKKDKVICEGNAEHVAQLAKDDEQGYAFADLMGPIPLTLGELDKRLERWIKFHQKLLMATLIQALGLPHDIKRSSDHVLHVKVALRHDETFTPSRFFYVVSALVLDTASAAAIGGSWPESLEKVKLLREECKVGYLAVVGVECPPLNVQMVPFVLNDVGNVAVEKNWKAVFITDVDGGRRFNGHG